MSILADFRKKDFIEQIDLLTRVQEQKADDAIPELFDLYKTPLNDAMVDHLVITSLELLLKNNESETVGRLRNEDAKEKKLCITIAGLNRFASAVPILHGMLEDEAHRGLYHELLNALAGIGAPESLEVFKGHIDHPDPIIASLAIRMVGFYKDADSVDGLCAIIRQAEEDIQYETCTLPMNAAVEALAALGTDEGVDFLVSKIHHRNVTIRRLIHDELISLGTIAVPFLAPVFDGNDTDAKILAANILGCIGDRNGGDAMVRALDAGKADHPNVRYAVYEAFGRIPSLKGLTCLVDALQEEDDLILFAVITSLNEQVNPGILSTLKAAVGTGTPHSAQLIRALVSAKSVSIFNSLYGDEQIAPEIMAAILQSRDPEIIATFKGALADLPGARARVDCEKLSSVCLSASKKNVLAVDDSKAMLSFYRTVAADLGINVMTAVNGKEALDLIDSGRKFDVVITDMNMPVMDGIEFTRLLRNKTGYGDTPVIMATTESEQSQRDLAQKAGVSTFITKPFTMDALKEKVHAL